jgi:MFS family permease
MVVPRLGTASKRRDRLGPDFVRLWLAQGVSNLGDGVYVTALPLLAATLTRDPLPVSAVMFAEWLPWLLFGLLAGALLDRWERRRVMWMVDAARLVVVGGFAAAVLLGWASIPLLMATGFLLGTGQTLVDTASQALIPALVSRDPGRLARANGRLAGTRMVAEQLAGPPSGGLLFLVSSWIPFALDAVSFGASSALVATIPGRRATHATGGEASPAAGRRTGLGAEIAEGLRWLFTHRVLAALALRVAGVNIVAAAQGAVLVLFAQERLGLNGVGFGLLLAGSAVGGTLGSVVAPWLSRRLGPVPVMIGGSIVSGLAALGVGLTRNPWVAGGLLALGGLCVVTFNVVLESLRQQLVPDRLLGRVISAFRLFSYGAVPLGALIGGVLARSFGLPAPFLVAGVAIPVMTLLILPFVNRRTVEHALAVAEKPTVGPQTGSE